MQKKTTTTVAPSIISELTEVELTNADGQKKTYWRKEVLPNGQRTYKGKTLDFSKINPAVVSAFDDGALDQVPFVLELSDHSHPQGGAETEKLEGDLHKLELSSDGKLFGYFDLSESQDVQAKIKKSNGKFGVSGRIEVNYEREDVGKKYPYVLSHVCGTTRPFIKGMSPWETVELSEGAKSSETIDFSTEVIDETTPQEEVVNVDVPKEKLDELFAWMAEQKKAEADLLAVVQDQKPTELTETDKKTQEAIELSDKKAQQALEFAEKAHTELAATRWASKRLELTQAGVAPSILDKAEKVMSRYQPAVLEFSENGTKTSVNATEVIAEILEECKGFVDLSDEGGHSHELSESDNAQFEAFLKSFQTEN